MRKIVILGIFLFAVVSAPTMGFSSLNPHYTPAVAGEGDMGKVQLIIKKLLASAASMKDFDELEKAGMAKKDVDRMRRAMEQKIKQMSDEAVDLINAL